MVVQTSLGKGLVAVGVDKIDLFELTFRLVFLQGSLVKILISPALLNPVLICLILFGLLLCHIFLCLRHLSPFHFSSLNIPLEVPFAQFDVVTYPL